MVDVADEFIHVAADRRRYVVTHGDYFDRFETSGSIVSKLGSVGYELLLAVDHVANWMLQPILRKRFAFSAAIKKRVKRLVQFISDFETLLLEHARRRDCQGIICGHIHAPNAIRLDEVSYFNTGDWIENCSALLEYRDGRMEVVKYDSQTGELRKLAAGLEPETSSGHEAVDGPSRPMDRPVPAFAD